MKQPSKAEKIRKSLEVFVSFDNVYVIDVTEVLTSKRVWYVKELPEELKAEVDVERCSDEYSIKLVMRTTHLSNVEFGVILKGVLECYVLVITSSMVIDESLKISVYYLNVKF